MRRVLPLALLLAVSVLAAVVPAANPTVTGGPIVAGDVAWMITAAALVLLMTPGLSFFYGGMVQRKNVISTMLQSLMAMIVISILWVVVGFSLAFGDDLCGVIGNPLTFFMFRHVGTATHPALAPTIPLVLFALFHLKFAIITPALITESFAERVRFWSYVTFIALFSICIYCPLAHWTWHPDGFLRRWGALDFAGGTVVHTSAGLAALAGALVLGRRKLHESGEEHVPANIPFVVLGTGMLWFGWFGFNAGSALAANEQAALAFATTNTAFAWMAFDVIRKRKASALGACIGAVVGLVAITPAADAFSGLVAALQGDRRDHPPAGLGASGSDRPRHHAARRDRELARRARGGGSAAGGAVREARTVRREGLAIGELIIGESGNGTIGNG